MTAGAEAPPLRIAVASGKGGTGKTTVAVSLAMALADRGPVQLVDCDVEEPNAHLFLSPRIGEREPVELPVPAVDAERCTGCGACGRACRYGALAVIGKKVLVHPELCHGCGLCARVCPARAIAEVPRAIGWVERGKGKGVSFLQGVLDVGEPMATPVIRRLKAWIDRGVPAVLDAPPGTACPVIETLKGADFVLLVTEPTPFGLHDLKLAVGVVRELGIPAGVVINKDGIGTDAVDRYCQKEGLPVLLRIPMDRRIAESYARGVPLVEAFPKWNGRFLELYQAILAGAARVG
ncbi:ATP-binding protein [Candidatus Bipolaricaulota bacterium]|nr:ATP-binding protein [Candidatus Bipolaricaulota bacterium]